MQECKLATWLSPLVPIADHRNIIIDHLQLPCTEWAASRVPSSRPPSGDATSLLIREFISVTTPFPNGSGRSKLYSDVSILVRSSGPQASWRNLDGSIDLLFRVSDGK